MKNEENQDTPKSSQKLSLVDNINSKKEYQSLSEDEKLAFEEELYSRLTEAGNQFAKNNTEGEEMTKLQKKTKFISKKQYRYTRNMTWDINHRAIISFLKDHAIETGKLASVTLISSNLNLSRNTVTKHLKEYYQNREEEEFQRLKLLRDNALTQVYSYAVRDDNMQAMNMFFNGVAKMEAVRESSKRINNNYIQVNNYKIEVDRLKQLPEKKLEEVMNILEAERLDKSKEIVIKIIGNDGKEIQRGNSL